MEFILLIIFSLIFTLIKSLAEKSQGTKPAEPKFEKYPVEDRPKQSEKKRPSNIRPKKDGTVTSMTTSQNKYSKYENKYSKYDNKYSKYENKYSGYEDIEIEVQKVEDETANEIGGSPRGISLERDEVIKGIIMSEVLVSPRFKKPHKIR